MKPISLEASPRADAWREYRATFQNFSRKAKKVRFLNGQPDPDAAAIERALLDLETARVAYNESRNALARRLLLRSARQETPPAKMMSAS